MINHPLDQPWAPLPPFYYITPELRQLLEPVVAFHCGDYNKWRKNNPTAPGLVEATERLRKIFRTP